MSSDRKFRKFFWKITPELRKAVNAQLWALDGEDQPSWEDTRQPRALQFVNEATNELSLELRYPEAKGEYTLSASKKPDVGYWRGDVDEGH